MGLLQPLTREQVSADLHPLWDECAKHVPAFEHLWATMAHSPTIFRTVWAQLLELKRESPVEARHFETAIVVVSALNQCTYCVSHHAPLAELTGLTPDQVHDLSGLTLGPLDGDHAFPPRPGFPREDTALPMLTEDLPRFEVDRGGHAFDLLRLPVDLIDHVQGGDVHERDQEVVKGCGIDDQQQIVRVPPAIEKVGGHHQPGNPQPGFP